MFFFVLAETSNNILHTTILHIYIWKSIIDERRNRAPWLSTMLRTYSRNISSIPCIVDCRRTMWDVRANTCTTWSNMELRSERDTNTLILIWVIIFLFSFWAAGWLHSLFWINTEILDCAESKFNWIDQICRRWYLLPFVFYCCCCCCSFYVVVSYSSS